MNGEVFSNCSLTNSALGSQQKHSTENAQQNRSSTKNTRASTGVLRQRRTHYQPFVQYQTNFSRQKGIVMYKYRPKEVWERCHRTRSWLSHEPQVGSSFAAFYSTDKRKGNQADRILCLKRKRGLKGSSSLAPKVQVSFTVCSIKENTINLECTELEVYFVTDQCRERPAISFN